MAESEPPSDLVALVADPNPYGARLVRDVLAAGPYGRVVVVRDGAEALDAFADRRPDLLVIDWQLPVIGAREIVAAARDAARSHAPGLPVVVTMTEPTASAVASAVELRVDAILARPFSPKDLRRRLDGLARRAPGSR